MYMYTLITLIVVFSTQCKMLCLVLNREIKLQQGFRTCSMINNLFHIIMDQ